MILRIYWRRFGDRVLCQFFVSDGDGSRSDRAGELEFSSTDFLENRAAWFGDADYVEGIHSERPIVEPEDRPPEQPMGQVLEFKPKNKSTQKP